MNDFDHTLEQVLKQSKYNILTGRVPDIRKIFTDIVVRLVQNLIDLLNINISLDTSGGSRIAANIVIGVVGFVLAALLAVLILMVLRGRKKRASFNVPDILEDIEVPLNHFDLKAHSDMYAKSGNYRESIRYRYIAFLAYLHEKGLISLYTARTNNQIIKDLKKKCPEYYRVFGETAGIFERTWFGLREPEPEQFVRYCGEIDGILRES